MLVILICVQFVWLVKAIRNTQYARDNDTVSLRRGQRVNTETVCSKWTEALYTNVHAHIIASFTRVCAEPAHTPSMFSSSLSVKCFSGTNRHPIMSTASDQSALLTALCTSSRHRLVHRSHFPLALRLIIAFCVYLTLVVSRYESNLHFVFFFKSSTVSKAVEPATACDRWPSEKLTCPT